MRKSAISCAVVAALAVSGAGCTSPAPEAGGPQAVFAIQTGTTESGPVHREEITDVGLPLLHNTTSRPVRIRYVQWVNKPAAAHILNIYAYSYQRAHGGVDSLEGDLPVACPKEYQPHPISSFVTPPHADAAWFIVIAFTINKVGVYHMDRVKIGYTTGGHQGWQYQNMNITMRVHNPPLPGPLPIPRSGIC